MRPRKHNGVPTLHLSTAVHFQPGLQIYQMSLESYMAIWGLRNLADITKNESALVLGSLVSAHAMLELRDWRERESTSSYAM